MRRVPLLAVAGIVGVSLCASVTASAPAQAAPVPAVADAAAAPVENTRIVPVAGTLADGTGAVQGTYLINSFADEAGRLVARATFTGTVTDASGQVREGSQEVMVPVTASTQAVSAAADAVTVAAADCPILHLDLAPLNLNLLGLVVDLDRVLLDIVARPGAGALLGNLLCAVTGLLDGAGLLSQIAGLLNQILAILDPLA